MVTASNYDVYGNAKNQTVTAKGEDGATLSVKDITTTYLDALRGLAATTDVVTKDKDNNFAEHQGVEVAAASDYDAWDNALKQTVKGYSDATSGTLLSTKVINTTYLNALRSLAATTDVVTTSATGAFSEHQVVTASNYDA